VTAKRTSTPPRLLVVDDDGRYAQWLGHHLGVFCPDSTVTVLDLAGFARWCETDAGRDWDIVLITASFGSSPEDPKARGLELLRNLRMRPIFPAVIMIAEEGNELTAVRALQLGAVDYLPKRLLTPDRLNTSVRLALRRIEKRVQRKLANLVHVTDASPPPQGSNVTAAEGAAHADTWASMTMVPTREARPAASKHDNRDELAEPTVGQPSAAASSATPPAPAVAPSSTVASSNATTPTVAQSDPSPAQQPARIAALTPTPDGITAREMPSTDTAATQLMAPGQLEAILNAANAAAAEAAAAANDASAQTRPPALPDDSLVDNAVAKSTASSGKPSRSGGKRSTGTPPPPVTAEFIPGYIIKMKIGESEKAVVYLATSISLGTNVALKVSKTLRDDAAGRQFLEREYTAIIAIRDPLVVQIYDYGVHAGFEYLAMEYLLRGDLKARMQAGLKEGETLRYVEQIASALRVVHNAGLLHRDLKPPNVMLRENDDVALIDFGLARALDGSTPSTRTGVLRGSPYYMSPEQAQGEQLDARSDFYSLGIMFYEMLTGRKPYTGATAMEVLQQHVSSPLPPLPHSLARYETFLHRLAAKNRNERFTHAEEIIAAIGELRAAMTLDVESAVA
jgi:serine/threonine-protein kinase PpkA